MKNLALVVYQWGDHEQDQLLANCIGPASQYLWSSELIDKFWFDRFDARGPHIYLLFGVTPTNRRAVEDQLTTRLNKYLAVNPSTIYLSPEKLEEIHRACQGKALCEADRLPGMAANNTYCFFDHPEHGYPLNLTRPGAGIDELQSCFTDLSKWSAGELIHRNGAPIHGSALRLIHAVDRELRHDPEWAFRFWRYAASTLIHMLRDDRFMVAETCLMSLPPWIGHRNIENFSMTWDLLAHSEDLFQTLPSLVALARREVDGQRFSEFALLREAIHCGLAQLGLPVRLRAPLLLFAMLRSIGSECVTTGP
ncbi:MAG TPA: lantibiotic dehydratase C-terminal domain-containing protein [Thermoanaerobaculia bacterium]|nr:lantibiotic dehydratase C-terminal domain-containing protein [Thermoanaerobaculia bacterium]